MAGYVDTLALDLAAFARHRHGAKVTPADVLLTVRRCPSLQERLAALMAPEDDGGGGGNVQRGSGLGQGSGARTTPGPAGGGAWANQGQEHADYNPDWDSVGGLAPLDEDDALPLSQVPLAQRRRLQ